jgi:hypothetical protein
MFEHDSFIGVGKVVVFVFNKEFRTTRKGECGTQRYYDRKK